MQMNKLCPQCNRRYLVTKQGLDGLWCPDDKCGYFVEHTFDDASVNPDNIFSEERVRPLRGVPMDTFCIGSEVKGRIQVQIPCGCTKEERRFLIQNAVDDLEFMKTYIAEKNLDIYTTRSKKE